MLDVIVVGAGPAGSAAAAILARRGCRVLALERAKFPRPKPCGDYLNPGCGAALARIGALEVVRNAAVPVPGMRIVAPDGTTAPTAFSSGSGYALPRETLDHLLAGYAAGAGASVVEEARVVGIAREDQGIRVTAEHRRRPGHVEHYRAWMVIGSDGLRSRVARMIDPGGSPRSGRFTVGGYLSEVAPAAPGGGAPPQGELHLGRDRYCGVAYLPGGLANVTVALARRELRTWRGALEARYWDSLRAFPGLRGRLGRARLEGGLRVAGPLAYWRRRAVADGVVLAGDAAAFMDPMTGQGVYLALRSGELAAEAAIRSLDRGGPTARILAGYERERRRAFAEAFLLSRVLQFVASRPRAAARALRRMAERPDLGTRFIDAVGNVERAASLLRAEFVACLLGGA